MTERSHFKVGMFIWYLAIIIILLMNRDGNIDKNSEKKKQHQNELIWKKRVIEMIMNDFHWPRVSFDSISLSLYKIHKN